MIYLLGLISIWSWKKAKLLDFEVLCTTFLPVLLQK